MNPNSILGLVLVKAEIYEKIRSFNKAPCVTRVLENSGILEALKSFSVFIRRTNRRCL